MYPTTGPALAPPSNASGFVQREDSWEIAPIFVHKPLASIFVHTPLTPSCGAPLRPVQPPSPSRPAGGVAESTYTCVQSYLLRAGWPRGPCGRPEVAVGNIYTVRDVYRLYTMGVGMLGNWGVVRMRKTGAMGHNHTHTHPFTRTSANSISSRSMTDNTQRFTSAGTHSLSNCNACSAAYFASAGRRASRSACARLA